MELWEEKQARASVKLEEAKAILADEKIADRGERVKPLIEEAKALKAEAAQMREIGELGAGLQEAKAKMEYETKEAAKPKGPAKWNSVGDFLRAVAYSGDNRMGFHVDKRLLKYRPDPDEDESEVEIKQTGPGEAKATMVENVGARGGFLVPTEYRTELLGDAWEQNFVRQRCTIIPMRRRQVNIPMLDQTGTTANQPHQYGGILAKWTEEQGLKHQDDPTFRLMELVAHKLVCYTRSSDELLDDEAIGLAAFLASDMGFSGAIRWQEEWAFLNGTGAGMPLGIIPAGGTITVPRQADGTVGFIDLVNMIHHFQGENPVWHIQRCQMAHLYRMTDPLGQYIFVMNGRDALPATLLGYDIIWTEKCPAAGLPGDVCLCDWKRYFVGDRGTIAIQSTNVGSRFQYDETEWRAVYRVDGQECLSTPWVTADGTWTISPFIILGGKSAT